MAQIIVLLETDFKNTLGSRPRACSSENIILPRILRNSPTTESKPLLKKNTGLNNNSDRVDIFPGDIDIGSDSEDDNVAVMVSSQGSSAEFNHTTISQQKHEKLNSTRDQTAVEKIKKEKSDSEIEPFEDDLNFKVMDKAKKKKQISDATTINRQKQTNNDQSRKKTTKTVNNDKIKEENSSDFDEDPFDSNSQNDNFKLSVSEEDTRGSQNNPVSHRERKKIDMKIKEADDSDSGSEYAPNEFGSSVDEDSDWETEKQMRPNKKRRKENGEDCDPNEKSRKKLMRDAAYFTCTVCARGVKTRDEKESHRKSHNLRYLSYKCVYRCPGCTFDTSHSSQFRVHYQRYHSNTEGVFKWKKCPECAFKTATNNLMKKHMAHHKNKGTFQCEYCSFSHDHKKNLTRHLRLHNKFLTGIYSCKQCSYATKHDGSLFKHKIRHHTPEEQIKWSYCEECPFKALEPNTLKKHMKRHQMKDGYECPHCTYRSPYACRIKEHLKLHFGKDKPIPDYDPKLQKPLHSCPKCSYKTMTKAHLDRHLTAHQTFKDRRISCAECPFTCKDKIDLVGHVKYHNGEGALKCPWCSFAHSSKPMITKHKRLHNDDREKAEQSKTRRKGEPRCPVCNLLFQSPAYVKRHMSKHQTIDQMNNPFLCGHCPHRSKQKTKSFINHIQCHFKTEGLKCEFCSFRHDRLNIMNSHKKLHNKASIKPEPRELDY